MYSRMIATNQLVPIHGSFVASRVDLDFVPGRSREQLLKTAEKMPLARLTTPDDVARAVVACIVNLTSSTGIVVPVDEGRHL